MKFWGGSCPSAPPWLRLWLGALLPSLICRRVARNSQWGGCLGGLGRSPQLLEAGSLGAKPPALENFALFGKNNFILGLF